MKADEIRRRFLDFFARKDHKIFPSASLVPEGDESVLFTGAGMNQFKDAFLGRGPKDLKRAASVQKCLRMPDLENVGRTASHHTFFEMLGNFSFGDYFKREAILWAVEFLEEELGIGRDRIAVTVYLDDDEAAAIWRDEVGIPADRIYRYGEKENFWPAEAPSKGPNGPCGPCSEIYFDFGEERAELPPDRSEPATDSGRYVEIWNLVFTQYERVEGGELRPLPQRNIDTGAGLERLARVLQGKPNNFETDLFMPILRGIEELTGRRYGEEPLDDVRMKRIADHVRAATFCIADGVTPSNEGRGYVVRKIVRRASMDLRELGREEAGLFRLVPIVVDVMGGFYRELADHAEIAAETIRGEETRFGEVYRRGTAKLSEFIEQVKAEGCHRLDGERAFFLWDTVGLPFDITKRFCEEHGLEVDEEGFERAMEAQRRRAREGSRMAEDIFATGPAGRLRADVERTEFTGYDRTRDRGKVLALLDASGERTESVGEGERFVLVVDRSPFYPEGGGQVGDTGLVRGPAGQARVEDTKRAEDWILHECVLERGRLSVGEEVDLIVDEVRRADTMRNHTATHLLHWALRKVLGPETRQAGSLVHPDYLRFDYTATRPPTEEELRKVEDLVNEKILRDLPVDKHETSFEEARREGAIALFGEKYGDRVRVVRIAEEGAEAGDASVELCGGTHCRDTGQIGLFKIVSDSAIAAGVRRIVAYTGRAAIEWVRKRERTQRELARLLKADEESLPDRVARILEERNRLEKEMARLRRKAALAAAQEVLATRREVADVHLYGHLLRDVGHEELRGLADQVVREDPLAAVVLLGLQGDSVAVVVACGKEAQERGLRAGDLCRTAAKALGGGGGGRPGLAQGKGKAEGDPRRAIEAVARVLEERRESSPAAPEDPRK